MLFVMQTLFVCLNLEFLHAKTVCHFIKLKFSHKQYMANIFSFIVGSKCQVQT